MKRISNFKTKKTLDTHFYRKMRRLLFFWKFVLSNEERSVSAPTVATPTVEEKYLIREFFTTNQCDLQILGCSFSESSLMTVEKWRANYSSFDNFQALIKKRLNSDFF